MKQFELTKLEKDTLMKIQMCLVGADKMSETVLYSLHDKLRPQEVLKYSDYRRRSMDTYIVNWFTFVGQWYWPLASFSRKAADAISGYLIKKAFNNDQDLIDGLHYNDDGLVFTKTPPIEFDHLAIEYYAEVKPNEGPLSLFPTLYKIGQFGWLTEEEIEKYNIDVNNSKIVYAYAEKDLSKETPSFIGIDVGAGLDNNRDEEVQ